MRIKLISKKTIIVVLVFLLILVWLIWKYEAWKILSFNYLRRFTVGLRHLGTLGVILYILAFMIATLLFLPGLPFVLLGGITYGTLRGTIYASIGDLLGAVLAFVVARYIMRDRVEKKLRRYKAFHEINRGVQQEGWRIVLLTRMVPVIPQCMQNYAYGLTSISFRTYGIVSFISIVPPTAVWIFAVNKIGKYQGEPHKIIFYLAIATVGFVIISYIPKMILKKKQIIKKK